MNDPISIAAPIAGPAVSTQPLALPAAPPVLDLWNALRLQYQATRPTAIAADGASYPDTTAGDVRQSSLLLSRALCHPRFDFARLADARAAWRGALERAASILAAVAWHERYPDNAQFWLGDSLALAQQLGAVAARRNGLIEAQPGPRIVGVYRDLRALWDDLLHWYCERRFVRRSRGQRFPETTVGDVRYIVRTLAERTGLDESQTLGERLIGSGIGARFVSKAMMDVDGQPSPLRQRWDRAVARWHEIVDRTTRLCAGRADDETYPDNPRFWLIDTKRFTDEVSAIDRRARGER